MSCCNKDYNYVGVEIDKPRRHDKSFKGPLNSRSCTDILCCIVFLAFVLGLIFISFWAFIFGDIKKLSNPTNSLGQVCGETPSVKSQPNLVYFNLFDCIKMGPALMAFGCPTKQICVSNCSKAFWSSHIKTGRNNMICEGDRNGNDLMFRDKSIEYLINNRICAEFVFPSVLIAKRCIPSITLLTEFFNKNTSNDFQAETVLILANIKKNEQYFDIIEVLSKLFVDFMTWYKYVCILFLLALGISLIYLLLLRYVAGCMVWTTVIMFVFIFAAGTFMCFFTYYLIKQKQIGTKYFPWYTLSRYLNDKFWLGMGILMAILLVILILILIFLRNHIRITIAILTCTSKSLAYMMGLFVWPVIIYSMQMIILATCVIVIIMLSSIRNVEGVSTNINNLTNLSVSLFQENMKDLLNKIPCVPGDNSTAQKICTFVKYGSKTYIFLFNFYVLFMFFWLTNFIKALGQITIAGAFASYYFAFNKPQDIPLFPVVTSFWRSIQYHLGSLAFGSLLVAIVQMIRSVLEFLEQRAKASNSIIAIFILKCFKCCFWCLEKFIKLLNKNAYIMIAIYGQNYCLSAMNAFSLLSRNLIRVFVVDKVTDFVLFIAKLVIVGIFGVLSFAIFNGMLGKLSPKLFYFYVPIIVLIVGTYIISSTILQVFELGVETIFLCFCEDLERNNGSEEQPYYMTKNLQSVLMKYNRKSFELKEAT